MVFYLWITLDYVNGKVLLSRNSFLLASILYWGLLFLAYYGKHSKRLEKFKAAYGNDIKCILFIFIPLGAFYLEEVIYNPFPLSISWNKILINYVLYLGLQIGITLLFHSFRAAGFVVLLFAWVYGIANYYVMEFKGNPLLPSDLMAYRTAAAVVGSYDFVLANSIIFGTLLLLLLLSIVWLMSGRRERQAFSAGAAKSFAGIVWLASFFSAMYSMGWHDICGIVLDAWQPQNSYYENGALLAFLVEMQELSVSAPTGYSRAEASGFMKDGIWEQSGSGSADNIAGVFPSVIVIMNESFSDLTALAEFDDGDCLDYWYSIDDYIMRGNAYASVIGGGTCNSEFEFLTGNSIANLSSNGYPYQMFQFNGVFSLVSEFAQNGYDTIAIHPFYRNNWNRSTVYSQLGFNSFISLLEMESPEFIGYNMSDEADYRQVISSYEDSDGPVFIFNVTMQNHGGYEDSLLPETMSLIHIDKKYRNYADVVTYMTLIRESDRAFAGLLEYFSQVAEPVIICMFGDHQPTLNAEFLQDILDSEDTSIENRQKRCCVPYMIWSNYDVGVRNIDMDTSLNYLGMDLLELAGFSAPYARFLTEMQKEIPVINKYGYLTADGIWKAPDEPNKLLETYRQLQYYMLFDHMKR